MINQRVIILTLLIVNFPLSGFLCGTAITFGQSAETETSRNYDDLLQSIVKQSADDQIISLQSFLLKHPGFEDAYSKLLERCLIYRRLDAAQSFFQPLLASRDAGSHAAWMLVRIAFIERDTLSARQYMKRAVCFRPVSFSLAWRSRSHFPARFKVSEVIGQCMDEDRGPLQDHAVDFLMQFHAGNFVKAVFHLDRFFHEEYPPIYYLAAGECYYQNQRHPTADSLWRIGLALAQRQNFRLLTSRFQLKLAQMATLRQMFTEALARCDSARHWANRFDEYDLLLQIEGHCGEIAHKQGELATALEYYTKACEFARALMDRRMLVRWLKNKAQILYELGRLDEAFHALQICEEIVRKDGDERALIDLLMRKAFLYDYINLDDFARKIYEQVLQLSEKLVMELYRQSALVNIANMDEKTGEYDRVRRVYHAYVEYLSKMGDSPLKAYWIGRIAATFLAENNYAAAHEHYLHAYKVAQSAKSKTYMGWYLIKLADLQVLAGEIEGARKKYRRALDISISEANVNMQWQVYLGLGNAHYEEGALSAAIASYLQAARIIEAARTDLAIAQLKIGYFSERLKVYQKLSRCYLERYEQNPEPLLLDSLFYFVESCRGRSLQDRLPGKKAAIRDEPYQSARRQLTKIQRSLRKILVDPYSGQPLDIYLHKLDSARYALMSERLKIANRVSVADDNSVTTFKSFSEIMTCLQKRNMGMIDYHISGDASFALASDGHTVRVVRLNVRPDSLFAAIEKLVSAFHSVSPDAINSMQFEAAVAHRLYQQLFAPVVKAIALPTRLLVVADFCMANLPFDILLTERPFRPRYTPNDSAGYSDYFLLHRHAFIYCPSALLLADFKTTARPRNILVLADPVSEDQQNAGAQLAMKMRAGWDFSPLVFAAAEAAGIKKVHKRTRVYTRTGANMTIFLQQAPRYDIIHFATHGFVDYRFDAFSGLVLAPSADSTDDGLLMGYEIADLRLNPDLITLSACKTGCGKMMAGEGVLGLPRLFLGAGAKTVLMTLWKVDDRFTSSLMPAFYQFYLQDGKGKVDALRLAKLKQISGGSGHAYRHPFYWASFNLFGDPGGPPALKQYPLLRWPGILLFIFTLTLVLIIYRLIRKIIR